MKLIKLTNDKQSLTILTLGATIHEWNAFSDQRNIVVSNKNIKDYADPKKGYFNTTVGRVANRIKDGQFELNGIKYQLARNFHGNNHGHGGPEGFFSKNFDIVNETDKSVVLKYVSKDGEEGYPGTLTLFVTYELDGEYVKIIYDATTDSDTIANFTNHAHFNLSHEPTVLNHKVKVSADKILTIDNDLVPTGDYIDVTKTPFDLRTLTNLGDVILDPQVQQITNGLDHAFLFGDKKTIHLRYQDKNLLIETTYPGVQIYSMNHPVNHELLHDRQFEYHAGIAFEPQFEPNAINIPHFNQPVLKKGEQYHQEIIYRVFEKKNA